MYSDDHEYRNFLRRIMQMDPQKMYETEDVRVDPTDPTVDAETIDEYTLDVDSMKVYLDTVYAQTRSVPAFQTLYELAAALMFSTNPEIGLAVLMSYDYLAWFFCCYSDFVRDPAAFDSKTHEYYCKLLARLTSK